MLLKITLTILVAPILVFAPQTAGKPVNPVETGRALAIEACSACHQVTATQKRPSPVPNPDEGIPTEAPTFRAIAERCTPADRLRAEVANPHYPMREQMLDGIDLDALAAYIRSLAPAKTCPMQ